MPDLRKKIFENGKTISKKAARSRQQSIQPSPASSRGASRTTSQHASEEDDSDYDNIESLPSSLVNSEGDEEEEPLSASEILHSHVVDMLDEKRLSSQGKERRLTAYTEFIRHHWVAEALLGNMSDVVPSLLRSLRNGKTAQVVMWSLRALSITIITTGSNIHRSVYSSMKSLCQDTEYGDDNEAIKVNCLRTMAISVMCAGGSATDAGEFMEFLLDIIESDGHVVDAGDSGPVVTAALEAWGFVASGVEDLGEESTRAIEAFIEQLDSSDVNVQVAAGAAIALLLEAAREHEEETDEPWNLRYDHDRLLQQLTALTRESSKSISKKDRRQLHSNFKSVVTSLELGKGPGYSTAYRPASNPHTGGDRMDCEGDKEYGYKQKFRVQNVVIIIDTWTLSSRLSMLKTVLGNGLAIHYMFNEVVRDMLSGAETEMISIPAQANLRKLPKSDRNRGKNARKEHYDY